MKIHVQNPKITILLISIIILLIITSAYLGFKLKNTTLSLEASEQNLLLTSEELALKEKELSQKNGALTDEMNTRLSIEQTLAEEKNKNDSFEKQVKKIANTVGTLEKLAKTDKELLSKYSKVYFLNEHYVPSSLEYIDEKYLQTKSEKNQIHGGVYPHLLELFKEAEEDGVNLQVNSSYRSFTTQAAIKSSYKVTFGAGTANQFAAEQGFSEHQLGTTLDFAYKNISGDGFENTEGFKWLVDNAYKHGFILSYPKGNKYYIYEPWHWRFVGRELARNLHREDKNFYDWDQRNIDEYLVTFFD